MKKKEYERPILITIAWIFIAIGMLGCYLVGSLLGEILCWLLGLNKKN